jgi:ATP synthase protein I
MRPEDVEAFERRAADLGARIDRAQGDKEDEATAAADRANRAKGMALGLRMSSEFVAAILVGGLLGYLLDKWLGTVPWLFLLFFVLGLAAGVLNVMRGFRQIEAEIAKRTGGDIGHPVPDDDD